MEYIEMIGTGLNLSNAGRNEKMEKVR